MGVNVFRYFPLALVGLLIACSGSMKSRSDSGGEKASNEDVVSVEMAANLMDAPAAKMAPRTTSMRFGGGRAKSMEAFASDASPPPKVAVPSETVKRMVSYTGDISWRYAEPEKLLDSALILAQSIGGFVENRRAGYMVLKVPTERFELTFQALLKWADVLNYSQGAEDITAEFRDTELRQKIVSATVTRLESLVARAKGDLQKLRLLGELKRYREELESLLAQKKALQKRADFASITLQAQGFSFASQEANADFPEFAWIRTLDPFHPQALKSKRLRFATPKGFVATSQPTLWRATGAEGAEMWARALCPGLKGDSRFWREAVYTRLKGQFKSVDTMDIGGVQFCHFISHGPRTYHYWVGVQSVARELRVVELYFPDETLQQKYSEAMSTVLKQGRLKWFQRS